MICVSDLILKVASHIQATKKPGEKLISGDGYYMIKKPEGYKGKTYIDGRYIYEHRYIMEKKLGRPLKYNENVDHKDGNKLNNKPSNLVLKTRAEHTRDTKPAKKARYVRDDMVLYWVSPSGQCWPIGVFAPNESSWGAKKSADITRFVFNKRSEYGRARDVLDKAIKEIGTGHFDYGRTETAKEIRILNPRSVPIIEGLFKRNRIKGFQKSEDTTNWI